MFRKENKLVRWNLDVNIMIKAAKIFKEVITLKYIRKIVYTNQLNANIKTVTN